MKIAYDIKSLPFTQDAPGRYAGTWVQIGVKGQHWALIFMKDSAVPGSKALPTVRELVKTLPLRLFLWEPGALLCCLTASPRASAQRRLKSRVIEKYRLTCKQHLVPGLKIPFCVCIRAWFRLLELGDGFLPLCSFKSGSVGETTGSEE